MHGPSGNELLTIVTDDAEDELVFFSLQVAFQPTDLLSPEHREDLLQNHEHCEYAMS